MPSPYGQAFVTSQTLDVYQQTLLQTNTVFGFVACPELRRSRATSTSSRSGSAASTCGPASSTASSATATTRRRLPTARRRYTTSTGEMEPLYDGNFYAGRGRPQRQLHARSSRRTRSSGRSTSRRFTRRSRIATDTAYATLRDDRLVGRPDLATPHAGAWTSTTSTSGRRAAGRRRCKHTYTTTYEEVYTTTSATRRAGRSSTPSTSSSRCRRSRSSTSGSG